MKIFSTRSSLPLLASLLALAPLGAQDLLPPDPVLVEAIAPLLMREDQRLFDSTTFANALRHNRIEVRHSALFALAHIGDKRATAIVVPVLFDSAPGIVADAFFALGLLADSTAVDRILERLRLSDSLSLDAAGEAATALIRIGSGKAIAAVAANLSGRGDLPATRIKAFRQSAALAAWQLGERAPRAELTSLAASTDIDLRYPALYSLARLKAVEAAQLLLGATRDRNALIQHVAIRSLTREYAEQAGIPAATVKAELIRALQHERPSLRAAALITAGTWNDPDLVDRVKQLLTDPDLNNQVQAATTLGALGGNDAAKALENAYSHKNATWALKRSALLALAHVDPSRFAKLAGNWLKGTGTSKVVNPAEKVAALQGWGIIKPEDTAPFEIALTDSRPEVVVAALEGWHQSRPADPFLLRAAKERLRHPDPLVREAALTVLDSVITVGDLTDLFQVWQLGTVSHSLDDRQALIRVLGHLADRAPDLLAQIATDPSRSAIFNRPSEMLLRRQAAESWPVLAQRWGAVYPVETGRSLDDYRGIVRTMVLGDPSPRVAVELEGRGLMEIELFPREAPLTVANFLQLVDRRYFDANQWHRVVPDFVVQTGDPTGGGGGGTGTPIREELNRRRFDQTMVGMATAGPDTGTSQWFITIGAQPHLNGRYTIFGQLRDFGRTSNALETAFSRITQGDLIRSIRRVEQQ